MSKQVLTTLQATVMTKTKEALMKHSRTTGLSIGEVIDRLTINFAVDDPGLAANLLCEEVLLMVTNQTEEQVRETIKNVVATLTAPILLNGNHASAFFNEVTNCIRKIQEECGNL